MTPQPQPQQTNIYAHPHYVVRRKVFKLFGGAFHVYGPDGQVVMYSKQKAFKLKEDIRLYTGEDMQVELLRISARQMIDFSAAYDVVDPIQNVRVGALRRKGLKSVLKDEWVILDAYEREVGLIQEDSWVMATVRRFLTNIIPQSYTVSLGGTPIAVYKQNFNPFVYKLRLDFSRDPQFYLDRRLGLAAGILLAAVEGRQG